MDTGHSINDDSTEVDISDAVNELVVGDTSIAHRFAQEPAQQRPPHEDINLGGTGRPKGDLQEDLVEMGGFRQYEDDSTGSTMQEQTDTTEDLRDEIERMSLQLGTRTFSGERDLRNDILAMTNSVAIGLQHGAVDPGQDLDRGLSIAEAEAEAGIEGAGVEAGVGVEGAEAETGAGAEVDRVLGS
ncbi:hypothetical protein BGX34_011765 [Mortierella sp. NVP85]|nr:hypothetical protein BGX34_011765 [Mortierella sp. NVP85]